MMMYLLGFTLIAFVEYGTFPRESQREQQTQTTRSSKTL